MNTNRFCVRGWLLMVASSLGVSVSAQCLQWESTFATEGFDGAVNALLVYQSCTGGEPSLYAGGAFLNAGGTPCARVARWNGSDWSPVGAGLPGVVNALCAYDDGSGTALYAAGGFGAGGCGHDIVLAKWDGSTWSLICDPDVVGGGGPALALAVYQNELYVGGLYDYVISGSGVSDIVRWNGTDILTVGSGVSGMSFTHRVEALFVFDSGSGPELVAGGEFSFPAKSIARWNGVAWSAFGAGLGSGTFDTVNALAAFDGGSGVELHAAGSFSGGSFARWDGSAWQSVGGGTDGEFESLLVYGDGSGNPAGLYAGGAFANLGGSPFARIARWDGSAWSALGTGIAGSNVFALAAFDDHLAGGSDLYAGGNFATAGGVASPHIGEWSGCGNLPGSAFCFGDGSLATPCPCALPDVVPNPSGALRHGCANSFNVDGAQLFGRGSTVLDNVVITSSGQSPAAFAFFIVGTADIVAGFATADGVRCAGGAITRFGSQFAVCGSVRYPNPAAGWTLPLSTVSGTTPGSGLTKYYQVFYRNAAAGFCSAGTANFTSGYQVVW